MRSFPSSFNFVGPVRAALETLGVPLCVHPPCAVLNYPYIYAFYRLCVAASLYIYICFFFLLPSFFRVRTSFVSGALLCKFLAKLSSFFNVGVKLETPKYSLS